MDADTYDACARCGMRLNHPIIDLDVSALGLYDDARYPGRCLLMLNEHYEDMTTMPHSLASGLLMDARRAAAAIQQVTNADRMNYAVLGNVAAHVHYHLIPRRWEIDPAPHRSPWQTKLCVRPLEPNQRIALVAAIRAAASVAVINDARWANGSLAMWNEGVS